jgi:glycosyltransferase involved in cell wall biosynthesis
MIAYNFFAAYWRGTKVNGPILNIERLKGPRVEPIAQAKGRPLWSVMIPAFNCAKYLRQCLESVLAQDSGNDRMEIEVVDDCSTEDDPEAVVRGLGQGRVKFHRKSRNEGVTANFNTCVQRSSGALVHILHGDDYVLPEFYRKMEDLAQCHPAVSFFHARGLVIDEAGHTEAVSPTIESLTKPGNEVAPFYYANPFRTAGVVVRRTLYEQHGGFNPNFVHVADWEMWVRAIFLGTGLCLDEPLATYRSFAGNDTSRLVRTGTNLVDCLRLADHWVTCGMPGFNLRSFREMISTGATIWAEVFRKSGDAEAHSAYLRLCEEMAAAS